MHSHPSFLSLPISGQVDCTFPLPAAWAKPFGVSLDASLSFISYIHLVRNTYQFYFQSTSRIQARLSISATTWSQLPTIPPGLRQTPPPPPAPTLTPYTLFSTQWPKWCCKDIQHCHSSAQKSPMASLLFHMEANVLIMASQTQRGLSPPISYPPPIWPHFLPRLPLLSASSCSVLAFLRFLELAQQVSYQGLALSGGPSCRLRAGLLPPSAFPREPPLTYFKRNYPPPRGPSSFLPYLFP